jgi:acetylornithine deacetylase
MDQQRIIARTLELVRTPSPTGNEHAAIGLVASWLTPVADETDAWVVPMSELEADPDFPGTEVDRDEVPVVAARIVGNRPGPSIVLTGHVDTVPVGDASRWSHDPAGEIEGGVIYGRGSVDMKSGVVAAVEAFTVIAGAGRDFPGEVLLVAVPGEEDGGTGTLAAIRRGWTGDYAIITEPTSGPAGPEIVIAHGGALTYTIGVEGRSAHAAKRLDGVSALEKFWIIHRALQRLETELNERETNPVMTALGLPYPTSVGVVSGGIWSASVMEQLTAEVRAGVTVDETVPEAEVRFASTLIAAISDDPWFADHPPLIERTGAAFGSASIDPSHLLVTAVATAAESVTGAPPARIGAPYGCDMAMWTRVGGAATLVYGPGDVRLAHAVDEAVETTEIGAVAGVLLDTVAHLSAVSEM